MKKINIAITGATGFLGRHVVERLKKERNISVFLFDRSKYSLFRVKSLEQFLSKKDVILHLAAVNRDNNINLVKINALGTLGLLEGMYTYSPDAKLIFTSSSQIYDEESVYGVSKKFAEELIEYYAKKNNIKGVILRISNIFGPGGEPFYNSVIATFVHQVKKGNTIVVNGNGKQKRDYIYVEDVVEAILKCTYQTFEENVTVLDICSGVMTSINDIAKTLNENSRKPVKIQYNHKFQNEKKIKTHLDYARIKKLLSWEPKTDFVKGLTAMLHD